MRIPRVAAAVVAAALLVPAAASAANYPAPTNPGKPNPHPKGKATLHVCKTGKGCFRTIQKAVNASKAGDTIRIADGTYREGIKITGHGKDGIKLVGDAKSPTKVFLDLTKLSSAKAQNGVIINSADGVTVNGLSTKGYKGNGFFAVNVDGYTFENLVAEGFGTYGIYAFNSEGGTIEDSVSSGNNDSGFYIGQTPPQTRPKRSIVRRVKSFENVLGFSGTNMRYVTITNSDWFNNGLGIVPNVLASEKFPPAEDNVITGNRVFWNNFNYFLGAPFKLKPGATGDVAYPVGTGILLFGSRGTDITNNQVFGNYLLGIGMIPQILFDPVKDCPAAEKCQGDPTQLVGNKVSGNTYGKGGADLNGRDLLYNGSGSGNCFGTETYLSPTLPADHHTFVACSTPPAANVTDSTVLGEAINWSLAKDHEQFWMKHPHQAIKGITPLEHYKK
jgi:hypothetical protein